MEDQSDNNLMETAETEDGAPGCAKANAAQVETTEVAGINTMLIGRNVP